MRQTTTLLTGLTSVFIFQFATKVVSADSPPPDSQINPHSQFMQTLRNLCGTRFEGTMTFPTDGQDGFKGQRLVATVTGCDERVISIPFTVGEDRSRTWVIRTVDGGLELKHDHRHTDGTPHDITQYGGTTRAQGTRLQQLFPADKYTQDLIPEAATNVWSITFSRDLQTLTYHLERHAKPRFTAVMRRVSNTPAPDQTQPRQ